MLVSWELLKLFIDIHPANITPEQVAERLTFSGSEVEGITYCAGKMDGIIAARIDALDIHPANPKYFIAHLDTGTGRHICVTSATNMKQGDMVFYAPEGSTLPDGTVMGIRDFLGVNSHGMMLSAQELGLNDVDDPSGLLILPNDARPGDNAASLYHINDVILDVAITPNRGDLLSILGMAREINGLFPGSTMKTPEWLRPLKQDNPWPEDFAAISLIDEDCYAYRLGLATGAVISPSPLTARIDLVHLGMRPINNAVDVTNYVMLLLGQPLHAFDLNTLPAREITVRPALDGEHMTTLDGKDRALTSRDMLITSGGQPIALAGVMGGELTGINTDTTTIVIESASFSPIRVGHTSRRLGINSEAAFRFARTVDPELSKSALTAASALMRDWCSANVDAKPLAAENSHHAPKPITLTRKKLATYLSWDNMNEAVRILDGFGIAHIKGEGEEREFLPPSWRPDLRIEEDLIEEIGRWRGYNDVPDKLPGELARRGDVGESMKFSGKMRQLMQSRGYTEIVTYSFLPEDFPKRLRLPEGDERSHPLLLANPLSRDQMAMRTLLLPGLLSSLRLCVTTGYREPVRVFEQGRVFVGGLEVEHIGMLLYNGQDTRSVHGDRSEGFYDLKADVEAMSLASGCVAEVERGSESFLHVGQRGVVRVNGEVAGYIGRLKPWLEDELGVSGVYVSEVDVGVVMGVERRGWHYERGSEYPGVMRDVSLYVPDGVSNAEVMSALRGAVRSASASARVSLIVSGMRLFDEWRDGGRRSLAYTMEYSGSGGTMRDEEVDVVHNVVRADK